MKKSEYYGAFEEPGVIGTRIEIDKKAVAVLWRGGVVLKTSYKTEDTERGVRFILKNNGLRYEGSASDYASVKELSFKDGALTFVEQFPITGESRATLKPTENSRYGNYTEAEPAVYKELAGAWSDGEDGYFEILIRGKTLEHCGAKTKFVLLRPGWGGAYKITDEDPSKDGIRGLGFAEYSQGMIKITIPVCDAPPTEFFLKKSTK